MLCKLTADVIVGGIFGIIKKGLCRTIEVSVGSIIHFYLYLAYESKSIANYAMGGNKKVVETKTQTNKKTTTEADV